MYVRIARFEGGDPAEADELTGRVREQMQGDPPAGLEGARRVMMLLDRQTGRGLGMTFFETEDELRRGDEALNAMTPPGSGRRTSVETYEVAIDQQM